MKRNSLLLILLTIIFAGCEPYEPEMIYGYKTSDTKDVYIMPEKLEVAVGDTLFLRVETQNSITCDISGGNIQIVCGGIIHYKAKENDEWCYNGHVFSKNESDWHYFGGQELILGIVGMSEGVVPFRLYNTQYRFDTTIFITVSNNNSSEDTNSRAYFFYPEDRNFSRTLDTAVIYAIGPRRLNPTSTDLFILGLAWRYDTVGNGNVKTTVKSKLPHAGTACIRFFNEDIDTLIQVNVLPIYNTYTEPNFDFDDTEDSVRIKLYKNFGTNAMFNGQGNYYEVRSASCHYNLYINYDSDNKVDNFVIDLYEGVDSIELSNYIRERYFRIELDYDGLPIYIRPTVYPWPSMSDATVIVIPDSHMHRVTYYNPNTFSN